MRGHPQLDGFWHWMLDAAERHTDIEELFNAFCAELTRRSLPFWRSSLGLEILHPEVSGWQFIWTDESDVEVHLAARAGMLQSSTYLNSPTRIVDETEATFRRRLDRPCPDMPLLEELRLEGATDYLMLPLPFIDRSRTASISFATCAADGFTEDDLSSLTLAAQLFSPYAERHVLRRLTIDLLDTYVGPHTGQRIIDGQVERGSTEIMEAAVWLADLRGFTSLSERLPVKRVTAMLNVWLEIMVEVLDAHEGEVLKFIGDAVLAVFSTSKQRPAAQACADALAAAVAFGERIDMAGGGPGLDFALALHFGEVAYGNIGARRRLDFTVIGPAVNQAARLQGMSKTLGERVVMSGTFASSFGRPLRDLGMHQLRGVGTPQQVFGLAPTANYP
jgi:adenylate cyclase